MNTSLLRELRKKHGLTQEALAEKINISRSAYTKLESGKTHGTTDEALALSEVLGCSIADLLASDKRVTIHQRSITIDNKQRNQINDVQHLELSEGASVTEKLITLLETQARRDEQQSVLMVRFAEILARLEEKL